MRTNASMAVESLERRQMLSAGGAGAGASVAYPPHAHVRGESLAELSAQWWSRVFETPIHAADGTTVTHPLLTEGDTTDLGPFDGVFFLYGSFLGGTPSLTATVPTGTPIFVPVLPVEFSNFDTSDPDGTLPGTSTTEELRDLAAQAILPALGPGGEVHVTVDGGAVPRVAEHREVSPVFSYLLPESDNVDQYFFGDPSLKGPVSPAVADGFYVLLKPLPPGTHTITFGGTTPGGSLGPLSIDVTYTINVVPKGQFPAGGAPVAASGGVARHGVFGDAGRIAEQVL